LSLVTAELTAEVADFATGSPERQIRRDAATPRDVVPNTQLQKTQALAAFLTFDHRNEHLFHKMPIVPSRKFSNPRNSKTDHHLPQNPYDPRFPRWFCRFWMLLQ
jgi:hypothetical protein